MNGASIAGVLTVLHACIDMQGTLLDKFHYLLYFLVPSMNPRFIATLNEDLELSPTSVRVGQAVETVGQAGRPRTITGFQVNFIFINILNTLLLILMLILILIN